MLARIIMPLRVLSESVGKATRRIGEAITTTEDTAGELHIITGEVLEDTMEDLRGGRQICLFSGSFVTEYY